MAQPTTIKSGDPINDVAPAAPRKYSSFNLSYRFLQTQRFGEITPHCVFATVKGAKDSFRCMNDTSTYTLKAPLQTDMFQKRSNFFVPLQAILYNNWELITAQPNQGDDVADDVNGVITGTVLRNYLNKLVTAVDTVSWQSDTLITIDSYLTGLLKNMLTLEMFVSQGSLIAQLGYKYASYLSAAYWVNSEVKYKSFDIFLEQVLSSIAPRTASDTGIHGFTITWINEDGSDGDSYQVLPDSSLADSPASSNHLVGCISYRHMLDLCRQDLNFYISLTDISSSLSITDTPGADPDDPHQYELNAALRSFLFGNFYESSLTLAPTLQISDASAFPEKINFNRVSAYQIICAHFFSLDHVDYIYSAQLYRQLMQYYADKIITNASDRVFSYNGLNLHYDALSGYVISRVINTAGAHSVYVSTPTHFYRPDYLTALFSFRHSLRYLDYFTGGRTRPLSVGDVGVSVSGGTVNAVDVILKQNAARYLNFAQRVGRKISQWLDQLFPGGQPKPDMHDPQWLSATGDAVVPERVQNTGAAQQEQQNSITCNLKTNSNRFQFNLTADRPGYVLCVTYYDLPRAYAFANDRENYHADRYDMFNPFFQYNGSQAVYKSELGLEGNTPFAYQNKYMEYKQKYDIVAGGFVDFLPGYAFIADNQSGLPLQSNLNPTYVRSWNVELDAFYKILTGYGLAAYFHFICKNVNIIKGVRPMEYAPQLM